MKKILSLVLVLALVFSFTACSTPSNSGGDTAVTTIIDRAGNEINLPAQTDKIISLAPSFTQVLIEIGMADKLIGIDSNSAVLEGVPSDIAVFDLMSPDAEKLASLEPDLIFVSGMSFVGDADPFKPLKDLGICIAAVPTSESIEGIYEDLLFITSCVNQKAAGEKLVADMKTEIEAIAQIGSTITEKKTVLFEIANLPYIYSFGNGVFLNEMIELIGAENVLAAQTGWLPVEEEAALNANPDVILTNVNYIENPVEEILARKGWDKVSAVANKEVYYIDNFASSLGNHTIVQALKEMASAIYPDKYTK